MKYCSRYGLSRFMSGIERSNQPLSCISRSLCEALGSMFVEKRLLVRVYCGKRCTQSSKGMSRIHQWALPQWFVTMSIITFSPRRWLSATNVRYRSFDPKRGSIW